MRHRIILGAGLAALLLAGNALAGDGPKSGPQVGDFLVPFNPLNLNGPAANDKACPVWMNGNRPVVAIFARDVNEPLTGLVKKIDEATAKNSDAKMASWVVFCNDDEGVEKKLKELIDKEKIKKTVLAVADTAGPEDYKIAKDADVTVLLYVKKTVKVNYAFKKGELKDKDIDKILADLPKILSDK